MKEVTMIKSKEAEVIIKGGWTLLEPHQVHTILKYPAAQQIDGNWYVPKWGSDTIQKALERIRGKRGN
jgi:hypothetical protein